MLVIVVGCSTAPGVSDDAGNEPFDIDSSVLPTIDAAENPRADAGPPPDGSQSIYPDGAVYPDGGMCPEQTACPSPVADGCNLAGGDGCDGADNDCDGKVDEDCACTAGAVQSCFRGPPGRRGVGACKDGMQTCIGVDEFTYWGPCVGGIAPGSEVCDGLDNSCDGCVDDHPDCCVVSLACPDSSALPEGAPFVDYVIDGNAFYTGTAVSWSWTVTGGPCDELFASTSGTVSFTLSGQNTPVLTLKPTLSGDYTVTLTIDDGMGNIYTCTFIVHIRGPGMRIELCWDTTGSTDLDLHLHKPGTTTPWFTTMLNGIMLNTDDCYFADCKAASTAVANWGYANSPLVECANGPDGAIWSMLGYCRNPRLDVDNISTVGRPENINVDNPVNGATYRTMVHMFGGSVATKPMVNVYCGGVLKSTFGASPSAVPGFTNGTGFGKGPMWRVADITPVVVGGVTTDCTVTPLFPPGTTNGYWVTVNDRSY